MLPNNIKTIIDLTIGDGWLGYRHTTDKYAHFDIMHCIDQIEYAKHKEGVLNNLGFSTNGYIYLDKRTNKSYYRFYTQQHPDFSAAYKHVYNRGRKAIDKHLLRDLDEKSLAYMFMDDGSSHRSNKQNVHGHYKIYSDYITTDYRLSVNSFTLDEINMVRNWLLEKFSIESNLEPQFSSFRIIIKKKDSMNNLKNIVEKYIVNCMKYKTEKPHSFSGIPYTVISGSQTERENSLKKDDATVESEPSGA